MNLYDDAMQKLCKWRVVFAGWQLGTRAKGDPESDAVKDHREVTMLLRAEVSALVLLCVEKELFTEEEFTRKLAEEAEHLCAAYEERFPGFKADLDGMHVETELAVKTTQGWRP